jgi:transcriptional regulator with XRE-family HTH domain
MRIESKKLRKLRDSKRLSQQEVADKIGVSQSTYCDWEKQDSEIKLENLIKLSETFEANLEDLAPETTTLNIYHNNNHKAGNNSVIGFEVKVDGEILFNELLTSYKAQISLLEKRVLELEGKITIFEK